MAIVVPTIVEHARGDTVIATWVLTTADTTGAALGEAFFQHADRCWHATGTWGGATAAVQGSNTDTDAVYGAMTNASGGAAITWTVDGAPKQQLEGPLYVRPKLTTAGAGATVTVVMVGRRNRVARSMA